MLIVYMDGYNGHMLIVYMDGYNSHMLIVYMDGYNSHMLIVFLQTCRACVMQPHVSFCIPTVATAL